MDKPRGTATRLILLAVLTIAVSYFFVSDLILSKVDLGFPLDDSWIHYVFSRNAASGEIFTYNPHERVIGSTSPLWVSLLVPAFLLSKSHAFNIWWGIILGAAFHFLMGLLIFFTLRKFDETLAFLVALCAITTSRLVWVSLSGMETSLFYLWCLLSWAIAARVKETKSHAVLLGIVLALTVYARPEGYLLAALVVLWLFVRLDEGKLAFDYKTSLVAGLTFLLLISPYIVGSYLTWGHPLPTTFYTKRLIISSHAILGDWLRATFVDFWDDNFVMVLAALYGIYVILTGRAGDKKFGLAFLWTISLIVAQSYISNLRFHHGRYQMPVIPFLWVLAGFGLAELRKKFEERKLRFFGVAARHIPALLLIIAIANNVGDLSIWRNIYVENVESVNTLNVNMARYIRDNVPRYATVAVNDAGAIRYFGDHNILDLMGIVSPKVILLAHEKQVKPYHAAYVYQMAQLMLNTRDVDYACVFGGWFPFANFFPEAFVAIYSTTASSIDEPSVKATKILYWIDKPRLKEYLESHASEEK